MSPRGGYAFFPGEAKLTPPPSPPPRRALLVWRGEGVEGGAAPQKAVPRSGAEG